MASEKLSRNTLKMISQSKHMRSQAKDGDETSLTDCKETNECQCSYT